jgi:hypothetical protein
MNAAVRSVNMKGYCVASWQPEVVALATPLVVSARPIYVLNVSVRTTASVAATEKQLSGALLSLRDKARLALLAVES